MSQPEVKLLKLEEDLEIGGTAEATVQLPRGEERWRIISIDDGDDE